MGGNNIAEIRRRMEDHFRERFKPLDDFVGQDEIKKQVKVAVTAAKIRNSSLPHMLMEGPPGCGKTTMTRLIAEIMGVDLVQANPADLKNTEGVINLFKRFDKTGYDSKGGFTEAPIKPSILFLDEIHNLPLQAQELLGVAMENRIISYEKEKEIMPYCWEPGMPRKGKVTVTLKIPCWTCIGATTMAGFLSKPFLDRFKLHCKFETYSLKESIEIAFKHAKRLGLSLTPAAADSIARRSKGVARLVVRYVERLYDYWTISIVKGGDNDIAGLSEKMFDDLGIDDAGLGKTDIKILKCLAESRVPVGLENLAVMANENPQSIANYMEPYLLRERFMLRTPRGRTISLKGFRYLVDRGYMPNLPRENSDDIWEMYPDDKQS